MNEGNRTILETAEVKVRDMFLASGAEVPWHYHSEVADTMVCLQGQIQVELKNPQQRWLLNPGNSCEVVVGRLHRVIATSSDDARYLLVQGVGRYDFQPLEC